MLLNLVLMILLVLCELFLIRFLGALLGDTLIVAPQLRFHLLGMPLRGVPQVCRRLGCVDVRNDNEE